MNLNARSTASADPSFKAATYRLGCDVGGTFSDFVLIDERTGITAVTKCLSTPADPSRAILEGIAQLDAQIPGFLKSTRHFIHGTTAVINAVIERKGARTALLMTEGFRDILELRRHTRAEIYDIHGELPPPLVKRRLRFGIPERVTAQGAVHVALDEAYVKDVLVKLAADGVESVAVCFLHSYVNAQHERRVAELAREVAPSLVVSLSSDVLPALKEFERTSTTVVNAYVKPLVAAYLARLDRELRISGFGGELYLMHSGGGLTTSDVAQRLPVRVIESGPAAGVIAAAYYASLCSLDEVVAFDMGGTTAKGCLVRRGRIPFTADFEVDRSHRFKKGSGTPVAVPTVDLVEIGAGGGSIAYIDDLGLLQVGPRSAGADPGPICYARGGSDPTVTDADLVLGYLSDKFFLGGSMPLDLAAARNGIEAEIGAPLGVSAEVAAWRIHDLVNENMAGATSAHLAETGGDIERAVLLAFGGAGPVHAFNVGRKLKIRKVLIPPRAGLGAVTGFLVAPPTFDLARTYNEQLAKADFLRVDALFAEMELEAAAILARAAGDSRTEVTRSADMSYAGQASHVQVDLPAQMDAGAIGAVFDAAYTSNHGYIHENVARKFVNLRLHARLLTQARNPVSGVATAGSADGARKGSRLAFSAATQEMEMHAVYDRYALPVGAMLVGPAIVEEKESTIVIGTGSRFGHDANGVLVIELDDFGGGNA